MGISGSEARAKSTAWAITFADLVTLMLSFFVLLLVITNESEKHIDRIINLLLDESYHQLKALESADVKVERVTKGVRITMREGRLFNSLDAELRPEVLPLLQKAGELIRVSKIMNVFSDPTYRPLIEAIQKRKEKLSVEIRCEGHTDDLPLPPGAKYESNWDLSTARALNVVKRLSAYSGLPESRFSAMGYGEFRPTVDIRTVGKSAVALEQARAQNRRVEIYLDAFVRKQNDGQLPFNSFFQ
jgi:chemotaxis protein MotB